MNDTPRYILQKQFEIMNSKPLKERISRLFEMTELSRNIILNQLHIKRPELNEIDLKIELFRAFYRFDFDNETLDKIATKMKQYLLSEQIEKQTIKSV
ncbi:MAG: hypothetical protein WCS03_12605 [Bacteroidota bacterium]